MAFIPSGGKLVAFIAAAISRRWNIIEAGETVIIPTGEQARVFIALSNDGVLIIDGELIFEV